MMSAHVGNAVVMLHLERNAYYDLDAIGAAIWQHLESPRRIGELIDWLMDRYDVDRVRCAADVMAFVSDAVAEGIVRVTDVG